MSIPIEKPIREKIIFIASYADSLVNFRGELIKSLLRAGFEIHLIAPKISESPELRLAFGVDDVFFHNLSMDRTGLNPVRDIWTLLNLFRLIRGIKPQAVFTYTIKPVIYGVLAASLLGVPQRFAMITGLGYTFQSNNWLLRLVKYLYRLALSGASVTFFQNPDDQELFLSEQIIKTTSRSVIVNGSGVDTQYFGFAEPPVGVVRFLLIARLLVNKGVTEYVEAAKRVKIIYPDAIFGLVGMLDSNPNSIKSSELEAWVEEGVVDYYGELNDVRPAILNCSVYVLPSYREGTPRTVLEAMSIGRAIITTDVPGCRETVVSGLNGFLVEVRSIDSLEGAMVRFLSEPHLVKQMGEASRLIVEDKYDVHKVNEVVMREMAI